jgi:septal ring factor EnvC (AmiA/AmiB activator)
MATTEKIRKDIDRIKEKISEQQKRLRALESQLAEEENLEIVRMVKAVHMDSLELGNFLKAYASGKLILPKEAETETDTVMEGCVDEA